MLRAESINAKLEDKLREKCVVYPQNNLRCSSIGHPCLRYIYLSITNWQDKQPHDVGLQAIFDMGNTLEDHVIQHIKDAGYEVITPVQHSFRIEPQNITGRDDLRIKDPETGEMIPVEVKSLSPFIFDKLNCFEDFRNHKQAHIRSYAAQIQLYLYYFAKDYGFFALINKLTGKIKFIPVQLDYDFCESILQRAEYINKCLAERTVPDSTEDISVCEHCNLQHICGSVKRIPADVEVNGELEQLIRRKNELSAAKKEYEETDKAIKAIVGERDKIIAGDWLVLRKTIEKQAYMVPGRTEHRITIKRL